jgi:hypothetical protein
MHWFEQNAYTGDEYVYIYIDKCICICIVYIHLYEHRQTGIRKQMNTYVYVHTSQGESSFVKSNNTQFKQEINPHVQNPYEQPSSSSYVQQPSSPSFISSSVLSRASNGIYIWYVYEYMYLYTHTCVDIYLPQYYQEHLTV